MSLISGCLSTSSLVFANFRKTSTANAGKVAQNILRALAVGLGIEQDFVEKFHSERTNVLSYKHYPSVPSPDFSSHKKERLGSHTDMTSLTLLFQDDCTGLEVETQGATGNFFPADPIEGTLVLNIGDALMRWSNDILLSTVHRVQPPNAEKNSSDPELMTRERYSIPYFVQPQHDTMIECLPGCSDEAHPEKSPPQIYRELLKDYGKLFYPDAKVATDGSQRSENVLVESFGWLKDTVIRSLKVVEHCETGDLLKNRL